MEVRDKFKLASLIVGFAPLALFSHLYSMSILKEVEAPDQAIALYSGNGTALATLSLVRFFEVARKSDHLDQKGSLTQDSARATAMVRFVQAASATADLARRAYVIEPLSPKAHAVLALAENEPALRKQIIDATTSLNHRQLALQGLLLDKHISDQNYQGSIETIDQILRVHPNVSDKFFPILVKLLAIRETLPQFVDLFETPMPWRKQFLSYAVNDKRAIVNLAALRIKIALEDDAFDKLLIFGLAEQGEYLEARTVYETVRGARADNKARWLADYPPFEWRLTSERGMRAFVTEDGSALRIEVSPGEGGVVASRMLDPTGKSFKVQIVHTLDDVAYQDSVKIQLACNGALPPFFEKTVTKRKEEFLVANFQNRCSPIVIRITARAWSDSRPLTGEILSLSLAPSPID